MYTIKAYPDGTTYVETDNQPSETFRVNSYQDLWILNQLVDAKNAHGVLPYIFIPNLIDAQADRRFKYNQSYGLKLVIEFLNKMKAHFEVFHPHNPEVVEALGKNITITDNADFINYVRDDISQINSKDGVLYNPWAKLIMMSSDAGGFKPLMKLCDKIDWTGETFSAAKSRKYVNEKSELTQIVDREDFGGKDILIVDDLSVRGGTFIGLAKLLRERNCGKLYLAVSHMTVCGQHKEMFEVFDHVYTTDSKFSVNGYVNKDKTGVNQPKNLIIFKL